MNGNRTEQKYRCTIRDDVPTERRGDVSPNTSIVVKAEHEPEARIIAKNELNEIHGSALEPDDIECGPNTRPE